MTQIVALWLPIVASSVLVFIASSFVHIALPWHKNDYPAVPNQDKIIEALRPFAIPPGDYMIPRPASRREMASAEFAEKLKSGPVMVATVFPNGMMSMGRNFVLWFVYLLVIATLSGGIAGRGIM